MDRASWLRQKRSESVRRYDTIHSLEYDSSWGTIHPTHRRFIQRFMELVPEGGSILDAPCGTGKYWPMLREKGFEVVGVDQSEGMLEKARRKFPDVKVLKMGLQEMNFRGGFDGAICMDSMEFVPPEEWPAVLRNFYSSLLQGTHLYLTVEVPEKTREELLAEGMKAGLPVVIGEDGVGEGYHFHPSGKQVDGWCKETGFEIIERGTGDWYEHFILERD